MNPDQPGQNYDFIFSSNKTTQPSAAGGGLLKDPFVRKIAFIIAGALVAIIMIIVTSNIFFSSRLNLDDLVGLAQTEQEVARLGSLGEDAVNQPIKNAAKNTELNLTSHQQTWIKFLSKNGRNLKGQELALKKDLSADQKLEAASQASTFDPTYTELMRSALDSYTKQLQSTFDRASNKEVQAILSSQYKDTQLLLKQWPEH